MTKYIVWLCALFLVGCGSNSLSSDEVPAQQHSFRFENQNWTLTTPGNWQVLPAQTQVPFMAQKGSQNIAILERDLVNENPVEQIINSAEAQFFAFTLNKQSANSWEFVGQPGPTNTPRTFWQSIKVLPEKRKFLLSSCSQITDLAGDSPCEAIINSLALVEPIE